MSATKYRELVEYTPTLLSRVELPDELGERLWRDYGEKVTVDFPSPKTGGMWRLTSQGWVGFVPMSRDLIFVLKPKVPLRNVFGMLEYAYDLRGFHVLEGLVEVDDIEDFFSRLAAILAAEVSKRARKGLYRRYLSYSEDLTTLRGRVRVTEAIRRPWRVALPCQYEEHTADVEENQLLTWTLDRIAHNPICASRVLPSVRRAYRAVGSATSLVPFTGDQCRGRQYDRLNEDYRPMHALCAFFLDQSGPTHDSSEHPMIPFLIDMSRLFELFVARWLRENLPSSAGLSVAPQEKYLISAEGDIHFRIDIVLKDSRTSKPVCVLDTKYKAESVPSPDDLAQIIAYATAEGCEDAILVYPAHASGSFDHRVGHIRVRSIAFALHDDLEAAGTVFARELLEGLRIA